MRIEVGKTGRGREWGRGDRKQVGRRERDDRMHTTGMQDEGY